MFKAIAYTSFLVAIIFNTTKYPESKSSPGKYDYIVNYFDGKMYKYDELLKQYDIFKNKKKEVENAFYEKYNTRVDIKRIDYVYNNEFPK